MGARLYAGLIEQATDPERGTDLMQLVQHIAGVLVETYLVFDEPDVAMQASLNDLFARLDAEPAAGPLPPRFITPCTYYRL